MVESRVRLRVVALVILSVASLLAPGVPARVLANPDRPPGIEVKPARLSPTEFGSLRLPAVDTPRPESTRTAPAATPAGIGDWSRIVYQSLRNTSDWEIYAADGAGRDEVALTHSGSMEIEPRFNRGATRVAYASNGNGNFDIFVMNADGSNSTRLTYDGAADRNPAWSPDGTRIAFQSYRDGQSEIYVMNADGGGLVRLTYHGDYDGEPGWSPDGREITFSRRADGQYRIWVMNADGGSQRQLSAQSFSENPVWSPNGKFIAYDADGNNNGWQELWVMDATGANQHALTSPEVATDMLARSWSPDSRLLAFTTVSWIYYQENWYWTTAFLEVLDIQASGIYRVSASGADWNPDWQTLDATPPVSHMQSLPPISGAPFLVSWSAADEGPAGVDSADVQVRIGAGGAWTDWLIGTDVTSAAYPGLGGQTCYFRVRARDRGGNVEPWPASYQAFTTVESIPPSSTIEPFAAYTRFGQAVIRWDGQDDGGSSVKEFEVQYRDGASGAWQMLGKYAAPGAADLPGEPGHTVYVRARATDTAGNVESWPGGEGDTHTTLYRGSVTGRVRDNGGAPVVGVTVVVTPTQFATVTDAADGSYAAYTTAEASSAEVSLSKAGYGEVPTTAVAGWPDATFDGFLPPGDNVVRNWGFETDLAPAWQAGGSQVPARTARAHSGSSGVTLGRSQWPYADPYNISRLPGYSQLWAAAPAATGGLHVLWLDADTSGVVQGVRYAQRTASGSWLATEPLLAGMSAWGGQLAIDAAGNAYVAWFERVEGVAEVYLQRRAAGGQWSGAENVSRSPDGESYNPRLGVDAAGAAYVLWNEGGVPGGQQVAFARRSAAGQWSAVELVSHGSSPAFLAAAAVHSNGEVSVAWSENEGTLWAQRSAVGNWSAPEPRPGRDPRFVVGPGNILHAVWVEGDAVRYANRPPGGPWSPTEHVLVPRPGWAVASLRLIVDEQGIVHVGTGAWEDLKYLRRNIAGAWSAPEVIYAGPSQSGGIDLAIDATGAVYASWRAGWTGYLWRSVHFARRGPAGDWSAPVQIEGDQNEINDWLPPIVAVDGQGRAHLIWTGETNDGSDVFHTTYVPPTASASTLQQQITIPAAMSNPRLSFLYRFEREQGDARCALILKVSAGGLTSTVFSTYAPAPDWTHARVDLAPWLGKTVALQFEVANPDGVAPALVHLDEVTVGSTYPDAWVALAGPVTAPPRGAADYVIHFGNRAVVAATAATVTLQLPPELTFLTADPPPTATSPALTWDAGDLPPGSAGGAIQVRVQVEPVESLRTVQATAVLRLAGVELERANNSATSDTLIAYLMALPMIRR